MQPDIMPERMISLMQEKASYFAHHQRLRFKQNKIK